MGKEARKPTQRYQATDLKKKEKRAKSTAEVDQSNEATNAGLLEPPDRSKPLETTGENGEDPDETEVEDEVEDAAEVVKGKQKKEAKRRKTADNDATTGRGPEKDRTCPHCFKVIVSKAGLKYHIDNFVCRKAEKVEDTNEVDSASPPKPKKRKRARGKAKPESTKRFRGPLQARTCPSCEKQFSSIHGCEYHIKNSVCKARASTELAGTIAFPTLEPGSRFVTMFGIVEVIADDRAKSTYRYERDIQQKLKAFCTYKEKRQVAKRRVVWNFGFLSRLFRYRLRRNYESDNIGATTTKKAYYANSTKSIDIRPLAPVQTQIRKREDPLAAPEANAERIVTCRMIPDERPRFYDAAPDARPHRARRTGFSSLLHLRRRELVKVYSSECQVYVCNDCGGEFNSRDGYAYHVQSKVCVTKAHARKKQREEAMQAIQTRLELHLNRNSRRMSRQRKTWDTAVYPGAWLSLGFKTPMFMKTETQLVTGKADEIKTEKIVGTLDETLLHLRKQVRKNTVKFNDKRHGAIYNSVFKSLGFKPPKPSSFKLQLIKKRKAERRAHMKREAEEAAAAERQEALPPPEILDTQVLVDEAKSGRYPSIQRYLGEYGDVCVLCKDGGTLLCCDFCSNVVHLACMLEKVNIGNPEPERDFLCHDCARKIVARRRRAEKRRQMKHQEALEQARQKAADEVPVSVDDSEKEKYESDYHAAAAVGRELSELVELLEDGKGRICQMAEVVRLNRLRRLQIG